MNVISPLLTDLYQLTMAYGYWKLGMHERDAVFQLIFRKNPFHGNYAVASGLASVVEFLSEWQFQADDLAYLSQLKTHNGEILFSAEFLEYLRTLRFTGNVDAVPEGTLVFAQEPLLRVTAPLIQGQLLESALLNLMNFQTLIATKATRVCHAAGENEVLEFGLRRAQGPNGALFASRAAYIGGCAATSNVLAGKLYDIPVRGTHAHSWVTAFPDELSAFEAYAEVMPHNCVLLVDTYDTVQGVKNAITIGHKLREKGAELLGVRLDSGDMAILSNKARQLLDEAGFTNTKIIASNSLDEYVIKDMLKKDASVSVWGVGTNLVTSYDHPALDGVYKLSALKNANNIWEYKIKLSEQPVKISNPGIYQIKRFLKNNVPVMDVMYDAALGIPTTAEIMTLEAPNMVKQIDDFDKSIDLLNPIFKAGRRVDQPESIHDIRKMTRESVKAFIEKYDQHVYPVGLEKNLHDLKQKLIKQVSIKNKL